MAAFCYHVYVLFPQVNPTAVICDGNNQQACTAATTALAANTDCATQLAMQNMAVCSGTCATLFAAVATTCGTVSSLFQ